MKARAIIADPPYHHDNILPARAGLHPSANYSTMTIDDICAIPVGDWAADDCVLCIWTPPTFIGQACRIMNSWGWGDPITSVPWTKTYPVKWPDRRTEQRAVDLVVSCTHVEDAACCTCIRKAIDGWPYEVGKVKRGAGTWFMQTWEQALIGVRGVPGVRKHNTGGVLAYMIGEPKGIFAEPPKRHKAAKPYDLHTHLERFPGPRLEIFATETRPGWTSWGYDTGFRLSAKGVEEGTEPLPDPQGSLLRKE